LINKFKKYLNLTVVGLVMKINNYYYLSYLPYLLFFIGLLFLHQGIITHTNDDVLFAKGFKTLFSFNGENFLFHRYFHWSSRLVTEFFIPIFCTLPDEVWKFFDSFLLVIASILMPRIILNFKHIKREQDWYIYNLISIFLFLLFYLVYYTSPIQDPAGYITTSINYSWPFYFAIIHFYLLKKYLISNENKINFNIKKLFIYFLTFFSLVFAINQEMMLIIVSGVYFFIFGYFIYKKNKLHKILFLILFVIFLTFLFEYLSPGNRARNFVIYGTYKPQLPILTSLDLGSFFNKLINTTNFISYLFFGLLGIYTFTISKNKKMAIIGFIPIIILTISYLRNYIPYELITSLINGNNVYIILLFIFTMIYNIILIFYYKKKLTSLLILWLFIIGYMSLYTSAWGINFNYRTVLPYYSVILFLIELLSYDLYKIYKA
jgi:hypothetical protein